MWYQAGKERIETREEKKREGSKEERRAEHLCVEHCVCHIVYLKLLALWRALFRLAMCRVQRLL